MSTALPTAARHAASAGGMCCGPVAVSAADRCFYPRSKTPAVRFQRATGQFAKQAPAPGAGLPLSQRHPICGPTSNYWEREQAGEHLRAADRREQGRQQVAPPAALPCGTTEAFLYEEAAIVHRWRLTASLQCLHDRAD